VPQPKSVLTRSIIQGLNLPVMLAGSKLGSRDISALASSQFQCPLRSPGPPQLALCVVLVNRLLMKQVIPDVARLRFSLARESGNL
jgi:hypothetical protein